MRLALACVLVAFSVVRADTPRPDLQLEWEEGEVSRDASIWHTTITVTGSKIRYERQYSGRDSGQPFTRPRQADGVVKDPKKLAAALAAFDKSKVHVRAKDKNPYSGQQRSGCLTVAKKTRCTTHREGERESEELKALAAVKAVLLEGIKPEALGY